MEVSQQSLVRLGRMLQEANYQFTTATPATHHLVNSRLGNRRGTSLADVFGWSREFEPSVLPEPLFNEMRAAGACEAIPKSQLWRPCVRFSTLDGLLLAHSPFPTSQQSAVFFGPDSYRFVRAIQSVATTAKRIVDIGCGSGVGGLALAKQGSAVAPVVLADINPDALRFAEVNAELASVRAETVHSDVLAGVSGKFDLVIANPPYLRDKAQRAYRDGGGAYGEQLGLRITREALARLGAMPEGGQLLLYTGAAIVRGEDTFLSSIRSELARPGVRYSYQELDPDVFGEELGLPPYAEVERIAAVFLRAQVAPNSGG